MEGDANLVREIVREAEAAAGEGGIAVLDEPNEELVMLQVRETARGSRFYLGEALMTVVPGAPGAARWAMGWCWAATGAAPTSWPWRTRRSPVADGERWAARWDGRLRARAGAPSRRARPTRRAASASTKVDFSTMEVDL